MTDPAVAHPRGARLWWWTARLLALLLLAFLVYFLWTYYRIARQAEQDETRPADVIVVFGAAEYAGHPSPVFKARLDHAYQLYQRKLAPMVIVTGGPGDETYSEGGVGHDYLLSRGIPERDLIAETQAVNTDESAERVAGVMRANRMQTLLAVSDDYHMFRVKQMMANQGVTAYASPRAEQQTIGWWTRFLTLLHEDVSYIFWRLGLT